MRVVVFGYLGFQNFGDSLLLDAVLRNCADGSVVDVIQSGSLDEVMSHDNQRRLKLTLRRARTFEHFIAILRADRVECIGGTCFHGRHSGFVLNQIMAAMTLKKITWNNVGFESDYRPTKWQRTVFRITCKKLTVRDPASAEIAMRTLGVESDTKLDVGFEYGTLSTLFEEPTLKNIGIVLSPRTETNWRSDHLDVIRKLAFDHGFQPPEIVVLPAGPKDSRLSAKIAEDLGGRVLELDWMGQIAALKSAKIVVAERLHHHVVAAALGKQVFSVPYMEKNRTVLNAAGYSVQVLE